MTSNRPRAIVLAAGTGTRLESDGLCPKPMRPVGGVPLIVRVLRTLEEAGVREAVVVTGYGGSAIRRALEAEWRLSIPVRFVDNQRYRLSNGVSLLAARRFVEPGTILTMADHLYGPELVQALLAAKLEDQQCMLGVDTDPSRCFDIDDATKVVTKDGRIAHIGKELSEFDALDVGVFRIGPALVEALAKEFSERGDCSLSDGVRRLANEGSFLATDIGDAEWIDVDTPAAKARAEVMVSVGGERGGLARPAPVATENLERFAPTWVRAAVPYREDHFEVAAEQRPVRLMSNESPFAPSQRVLDAVMQAALSGNMYPTSAKSLREKLGERVGRDRDWVLLGAGSTELIDLVTRTFVAPGEEALISVPTFSMYEARVRVVGGVPMIVPLLDDGHLDLPRLFGSINDRTKLIFLCSPNNPTGTTLPDGVLRRVLGLGIPTIIDEAYWELSDRPKSAARLLGEFSNAILLRTFSKAIGLAGMRVGYAIARPEVIRLLARVKVPWNLSSIQIAAALAAITDVEEQEARIERIRAGRRALVAGIDAVHGVSATNCDGNFVLVDLSHAGVKATQVAEEMLERGVMVRSLVSHHAEGSFLRISVGDEQQNELCLRAFEEAVSSLRASAPMAESA